MVYDFMDYFLMVMLAAVLGVPLFLGFMVMITDGKVDYCYIQHVEQNQLKPHYKLIGHRPWRVEDTVITRVETFQEATEALDKLGCKVK